ncbi:hypothetical protein HK102_006895 [Quaeritorhiza haematococci]|nr:hypothetical protein HK102_006895 [Quaeritorhiza haematococci]
MELPGHACRQEKTAHVVEPLAYNGQGVFWIICWEPWQKWVVEEKSECPHCRGGLTLSQLIPCRFIDDLVQQLKTAMVPSQILATPTGAIPSVVNETGATRATRPYVPIHKEHEFEHLHAIYKAFRAKIDTASTGLHDRLTQYDEVIAKLEERMVLLQGAKKEMQDHYQMFFNQAQERLDHQIQERLTALIECKGDLLAEAEMLRVTIDTLRSHLAQASMSDIITNGERIIGLVDKQHPISPENYALPRVSLEFESEVVPPYDSSSFRIVGFRRLRRSQEVVYSEPLCAGGLVWRLKVYCSGNGQSRGQYLSVFVELVNGVGETSQYQYRVELVNLSASKHSTSNPSATEMNVAREFTSDFDVGECWGYNRFYRLDLLEREGFWDSEQDVIELRYHVRAPSYRQRCRDLESYILNLRENSAAERTTPAVSGEASVMHQQEQRSSVLDIPNDVRPPEGEEMRRIYGTLTPESQLAWSITLTHEKNDFSPANVNRSVKCVPATVFIVNSVIAGAATRSEGRFAVI